ncbi:MAG TPA: D-2-hydroxyacid dehydrogenase [Candidatus Paceibacterota bacterium]|nr:D-2-hydroxyacid dehydrogenase [Verrucomicrobiota bacterium]HSA09447.1 D-2-hydroxyacid dehydrogenase [Candidatus Paceibacterota bacterium]
MAQIVVLDGFTLNPGDLDWTELASLGPCDIHDRTSPAELLRRAAGAEILLTNKTVLTGEDIRRLPRLKYIGVLATGTNVVDLVAARARGIPVTNVPTYGTRSVAQMTFALLLELAHHAGHHAQTVREGRWTRSADFCYWDFPLVELEGLTLGIVGFGRIGRAVADLASAFGLKVLAADPAAVSTPPFVRLVHLDALFRESDIVSLHCPLTPETARIVNAHSLALLKPGAFLINTSRGPLVDELALADALNSGRLAGAALDVLSTEPPAADNPLLTARNCLITPHLAWATRAARSRLMQIAVENVRAFLQGKPQNLVN